MNVVDRPAIGRWTVLAVSGRIDADSADVLEKACMASAKAGSDLLAIDLAEVTFVTSAGLRVFVTVRKALETTRGQLVLLRPQVYVRRTLELSGFASILRILDDPEELV
ncbi:MAG: STAS domain-containing protein [Candidatus Riflebacteria bacterium]|nr:STAS domain-containing protein [Candidatus Riflebacteria bacterium]